MNDQLHTLCNSPTPRSDAADAACKFLWRDKGPGRPQEPYGFDAEPLASLCRELEREVERLKASWMVAAKVADQSLSMSTRSDDAKEDALRRVRVHLKQHCAPAPWLIEMIDAALPENVTCNVSPGLCPASCPDPFGGGTIHCMLRAGHAGMHDDGFGAAFELADPLHGVGT